MDVNSRDDFTEVKRRKGKRNHSSSSQASSVSAIDKDPQRAKKSPSKGNFVPTYTRPNSSNVKGVTSQTIVNYSSLPENWMDCPSIAPKLVADLFLAFKTPVGYARYNNKIDIKKRFNPQSVFSHMESKQQSIGLWIDLSNTDKYYNQFEFKNKVCDYKKLACKGYGEIPDQQKVNRFLNICSNYKQIKKNTQFIGVHCTYGFNRTGFFIVSYLIDKLKLDVKTAIQHFADVRPPGIYRQKYIDELYKLYSKETPINERIEAGTPNWIPN